MTGLVLVRWKLICHVNCSSFKINNCLLSRLLCLCYFRVWQILGIFWFFRLKKQYPLLLEHWFLIRNRRRQIQVERIELVRVGAQLTFDGFASHDLLFFRQGRQIVQQTYWSFPNSNWSRAHYLHVSLDFRRESCPCLWFPNRLFGSCFHWELPQICGDPSLSDFSYTCRLVVPWQTSHLRFCHFLKEYVFQFAFRFWFAAKLAVTFRRRLSFCAR